jgi:hypothetical protein
MNHGQEDSENVRKLYTSLMVCICWRSQIVGMIYSREQKHNGIRIKRVPVQLPYVQEEGKNMSEEEEKKRETLWWIVMIILLVLVIVGGAYLRWQFWTG